MSLRALLRWSGATLAAAWWLAGAPMASTDQRVPAPGVADLWLAPATPPPSGTQSALAHAVASLNEGKPGVAEPVFTKAISDPVLGGYALLYLGRAQLADGHAEAAAASAQRLVHLAPTGRLGEAAQWLAADAADAAHDWPAERSALETLTTTSFSPERAWLKLGQTALSAGDRQQALQHFTKVYYDFPLTDAASDAADQMAKLATAPFTPTAETYAVALGRAQQLYGARRFADAHKAFDGLHTLAPSEDRPLIALRLAECDYGLRKFPAARDGLRAYIDQATTQIAEAQYFYLSAVREMGNGDAYVALARSFVDRNADAVLAEEALNDLASYYVRQDDDAKAASVFAELVDRFPQGVHADRATWKAGWWAYRNKDYASTVSLFQKAAVALRRSDYRPSWLYWTGRAQAAIGERTAARETYALVVADYRNSYYGREAARALDETRPSAASVATARREMPPPIVAGSPPENATLIRGLLAAGLYDDAIAELRAVEHKDGTSPVIQASIAYALNRRGDLRPGITAMRRAYPQFIAEGGEALPVGILTVIFPIDYWTLIYKYATAHALDPYLMAALIAQESTFDASAKSSANAYGLMQILPSTGRQYAQRLGIRPFRTARLTEADTNLRIGMAYFADLVRQFGNIPAALAAYNAGEDRAEHWLAERRGLGREEFIDDIPYPETQNYVKRIIGQAEDYRLLYRRPGLEADPQHAGIGSGQEP